MSRYDATQKRNVGKANGLKHAYRTTIYQQVPEREDDMYFISQDGDRLDNLANRFYNDPSLWWFIARVNNLKTMNIPSGISLRIPKTAHKAKGF